MVQKLLEDLRNFGREPKRWRKPATPAQEDEKNLAKRFATAKHRQNLSSSEIQELKAIWASNSGDKHPVVTKAMRIAKRWQTMKQVSETCKRQKRVKAETAPGTDDESDQVLENRIAFHTSEAARLQSSLDLRVEHTVPSSGVGPIIEEFKASSPRRWF